MRFVRAMLAFVIAISLAMLPVGASAGHAMASDHMQASMHMAQASTHMAADADMSMDDCCPDDMKGSAPHKDGYKCGMGFCCLGGVLALSDVRILGVAFLAATARKLAIPADQVASYRGSSPPFRPPRI
ncbi:MAG: hypothetical protein WA702_28685 [Bradyrhizobium sp.]|jgi:hypothetical protein|uniref:hypothetical protein n=1 Tax=Bradyrhizobium sp. TaxID=376 RepID=UPI003C7E517E